MNAHIPDGQARPRGRGMSAGQLRSQGMGAGQLRGQGMGAA